MICYFTCFSGLTGLFLLMWYIELKGPWGRGPRMARLTCPAVAAPVDGVPPFSLVPPGPQGSLMWGPRVRVSKGQSRRRTSWRLGLLGSQSLLQSCRRSKGSQGDGSKRRGRGPRGSQAVMVNSRLRGIREVPAGQVFLSCLVFQGLEDLHVHSSSHAQPPSLGPSQSIVRKVASWRGASSLCEPPDGGN